MQDNGVRKAILSLTTPGAVITGNNDTARSLARRVNEYAANLRDQYPERFGFFAALPSLLDVPGTLAEIEYSLDTLKADGVTVFTRYGDGNNYLGHSQFTPIWKQLDDRKTVVHIHPTMPEDSNWIDPIMPPPMLDFPQETTRTAVDMIVNNVTQQFPNCPKILSHAGGTLPYLISRLAVTSRDTMAQKGPYGKTYFEFMEALRGFYYDLALSSAPAVLNLLLDLIPHDHIMYGEYFRGWHVTPDAKKSTRVRLPQRSPNQSSWLPGESRCVPYERGASGYGLFRERAETPVWSLTPD